MKAAQIEAIKAAVVEFNPTKSVSDFKVAVNNGMTLEAKEDPSSRKYIDSKLEAASRQAKQVTVSGNKSTTAVNALCTTIDMFVGELIKQNVMEESGLKAVNKEHARFTELANTITKIKSEGTTMTTEAKAVEPTKPATQAKPAVKKPAAKAPAPKAEKPALEKVPTAEVVQEAAVVEKSDKKDKGAKKIKRTPVDLGNTMRGIKKFLQTDLSEELRKDPVFMQDLNEKVDGLIATADLLNAQFNAEKYEELKANYNVLVEHILSVGGLDLIGQFTLKSLVTALQVMDVKKVKFQPVKNEEAVMAQMAAEVAPSTVTVVNKADIIRGEMLIHAVAFFDRFAVLAKEKITVHVKVKKLKINTDKGRYAADPEALVALIAENAIAVGEAMYRVNAAYKDIMLKNHLRAVLEIVAADKEHDVFEKEEVKLAKKLLKDGFDKDASFKKESKKGSWIETNILHPVYGVMDDFVGAVGMLAKAGYKGLTTLPKRTLRQEVDKINTNYKTASGGLWKTITSW